jgi:hypothetical protein
MYALEVTEYLCASRASVFGRGLTHVCLEVSIEDGEHELLLVEDVARRRCQEPTR